MSGIVLCGECLVAAIATVFSLFCNSIYILLKQAKSPHHIDEAFKMDTMPASLDTLWEQHPYAINYLLKLLDLRLLYRSLPSLQLNTPE